MIENTTLGYLIRDGKLLMLHRVKKENDVNKDKWIGVGGHVEEGESPEDCIAREIREETGYIADDLGFRGIVTFTYRDVTEFMYLFTVPEFHDPCNEVIDMDNPPECDEGELCWVTWDEIYDLPIWEGDRIFLKLLQDDSPFFSLKLIYDNEGRLISSRLNLAYSSPNLSIY